MINKTATNTHQNIFDPNIAKRLGAASPSVIAAEAELDRQRGEVVKGLLPVGSLAVLAGESGMGKSPLLYQLSLCVTAGHPFLGMPTTEGTVLMCDLENGRDDQDQLLKRQCDYLGIDVPEDRFLRASHKVIHDPRFLEKCVEQLRPDLLIIDTVKKVYRSFEGTNKDASEELAKLRKLIADHGVKACIITHHLRKRDRSREDHPHLEDPSRILEWFEEMRGPSSIKNDTDVRWAVEAPQDRTKRNLSEAELVTSWWSRVKGKLGQCLYLGRKRDDDNEAHGYYKLNNLSLLKPGDRAVFKNLPKQFRFTEGLRACGMSRGYYGPMLHRLMQVEVLKKREDKIYQKLTDKIDTDLSTLVNPERN